MIRTIASVLATWGTSGLYFRLAFTYRALQPIEVQA